MGSAKARVRCPLYLSATYTKPGGNCFLQGQLGDLHRASSDGPTGQESQGWFTASLPNSKSLLASLLKEKQITAKAELPSTGQSYQLPPVPNMRLRDSCGRDADFWKLSVKWSLTQKAPMQAPGIFPIEAVLLVTVKKHQLNRWLYWQ